MLANLGAGPAEEKARAVEEAGRRGEFGPLERACQALESEMGRCCRPRQSCAISCSGREGRVSTPRGSLLRRYTRAAAGWVYSRLEGRWPRRVGAGPVTGPRTRRAIMYPRLVSLSGRAPLALAALALALTAAGLTCGGRATPDAPKPTPRSVFGKPEWARNPVTLQLQADDRQVAGWVSGPVSYAGRPVQVLRDGKRVETIHVGRDNTFLWPFQVEKPTTFRFSVEGADRASSSPEASVLVSPPPAASGPCVFFVVDRTAYRPGQPLHFAGFLREQDATGEFVPRANQEVEVRLVSERKQVKVATLKLTSDAGGRVVGEYRFSDADALDHYALSVSNFKGGARVLLGEYRKSKVKLSISGKVNGEKMKLTFQGLDFLDKPVVVTKASFAGQVVRRGKQKSYLLKGEDFVYHEAKPVALGDLEGLSEEDLLLWEADGIGGQTFPGLGNAVLTTVSGDLKPDGAKPAEHSLELKPEWRKGDCAILVQGVITDANGREQRASATIPIEEKAEEGKKPVELTVRKQRYFTGEPIEVGVAGAGSATLVVMKLSFQTPSVAVGGFGAMANPNFGRLPAYRYGRYRPVPIDAAASTTETVRRSLVTAVQFQGDKAVLKLNDPGAYKLVAVVPSGDGPPRQHEVSVVVKRPDDVNALLLRLDKEEYASGERLTGLVHSRFADAKALLTLRDSTGIRLARPIAFTDGVCRLNVELPANLRYGCTVDVTYPDEPDHAHVAHSFVRVVPKDRILAVDVKTPDAVPPGATVTLDLQVNRKEPIDLVVSVYDQSLLGIAADRSVNIRDFFLADERADRRLDSALLQRKVGDVRLAALFRKAEAMLKAHEKDDKRLSAHEAAALQGLLHNRNNRHVYAHDVATLLRLAGVDVYFAPYRYGNNWYRPFQPDAGERLIDVVKHDHGGWHLAPRFVGNTLLLQETHTSYRDAGYAWHPVYGYDFSGLYGYGYGGLGYVNNVYRNQLGGTPFQMYGFRGNARGDSAMTWGAMNGVSANSMHSFVPEGQAFLSHLLPPGGVAQLDAGPDQSHIAVRRDFSDSAYWNARVRTGEDGQAKVSVKLPDSLTNWQVVVTAISPRMHVGSAKASFRTTRPIMVWPMLPRTFSEGDRVEVFASVHNRTDEPQVVKVRLKVENGALLSPAERTVTVKAKDNAPVYWTFLPGQAGFTQLLMSADCPAGSDASLKRLPVVRAAAEQVVTASGTVRGSATIEVPEGVNLKDARLEVTFAPSLAADMADTLNYLVDYPYGCVEQTMSRFLPAIKVAQVLRQFKVNHPELEKKLPGCVAGGIKRLLDLQQPDGGWGWNGNAATHEMMTPYALYGLLQAEKAGYQVPNETAVARGLTRLEQFINNMGDAQTADRVYCLYVFSHRRDLSEGQWNWLRERVKVNALSDYALALALEMAVARNQTELAKALAGRLRDRAVKADSKAYWQTAGFSRWMEDKFEITAQVLKAFVAFDKDEALIDPILGFFAATKRGDRWNSTKDTAMILNAMCDYLAKAEYNPGAKKSLTLSVNGGEAREVRFDDQLTKKVVVAGDKLRAGQNTLTFKTSMAGVLYRAVFRYWKSGRDIPAMDRGIQVRRTFHLLNEKGAVVKALNSGDAVPRGSYVLSVVEATQRLPHEMRYVLVENPRPSGGETVPTDDARFAVHHNGCTPHVLREDREAMTCFHHEQTPQSLTVRNVFLAELAGAFVVPPGSVELMYQTETRGHSGTFVLKVEEVLR
ncbi:MAG: alpha-2-macroglobulin family protein [Gemmataceae bacterium]